MRVAFRESSLIEVKVRFGGFVTGFWETKCMTGQVGIGMSKHVGHVNSPLCPDDGITVLQDIEIHEPEIFDNWGARIRKAAKDPEIDNKLRELMIIAAGVILHWPSERMDLGLHVNKAFEAGASMAELVEMIAFVAGLEGGAHVMHGGLEIVERVALEREAAGLPVPSRGLDIPPSAVPATYAPPMLEPPFARPFLRIWHTYHPASHVKFVEFWSQLYPLTADWFSLEGRQLDWKTRELLIVAIDSIMFWPMPLIDHHVEEAFNAGATGQEVLEVVMAMALVPGGALSIPRVFRHGVMGLERTMRDRQLRGVPTPWDRAELSKV